MGTIYIIGLGPGDPQHLTIGAYEQLKRDIPTFLRTMHHGTASYLTEQGVNFKSFDDYYENEKSFENVYKNIVKFLLSLAEKSDINYAVPGDPLIAEQTVQILLQSDADCEIIGGISFIEPVLHALGRDSIEGLKIINGENLDPLDLDIHSDMLLTQVYSPYLLSELKIYASELYGDDYPVKVLHHAGNKAKAYVDDITVKDLDRIPTIGHESTVWIPKVDKGAFEIYDYRDVNETLATLRSEDGCPWDREQTHKSLVTPFIEETYEAVDAIENADIDNLVEELGDVLLQVAFHTQIGYDDGEFYPIDVTTALVKKLIYRHPHVFSQKKLVNSTDVGYNWDKLKYDQKNLTSILEKLYDIPKLPGLMVAEKIIKRVSSIGFTWPDVTGPLEKVSEELDELKEAIKTSDLNKIEQELGDVLFSVVNVAYMLDIGSEVALQRTNRKFIQRFEKMDELAKAQELTLEDLPIEKLEMLWQKAKQTE